MNSDEEITKPNKIYPQRSRERSDGETELREQRAINSKLRDELAKAKRAISTYRGRIDGLLRTPKPAEKAVPPPPLDPNSVAVSLLIRFVDMHSGETDATVAEWNELAIDADRLLSGKKAR